MFDKSSLHSMLTNSLYVGRIKHKTQTFAGVHEPLVEQSVFDAVQTMLRSHSNGRGKHILNKYEALLRGLLYCPICDRAMVHNVVRRKAKVYRYYTCQTAIKRGRKKCASPTLPAGEMEDAVVDHIRCIATDDDLRRDVLQQSQSASNGGHPTLRSVGGFNKLAEASVDLQSSRLMPEMLAMLCNEIEGVWPSDWRNFVLGAMQGGNHGPTILECIQLLDQHPSVGGEFADELFSVYSARASDASGYLFDKSSVHYLLKNPLYIGRIKHKEETFKGEHQPIVDRKVFDAVQTLLRSNSRGKGNRIANKYDSLLRGLLVCPQCNKAMVHNVARRDSRVYRYYTCQTAIKRGYKKCAFPTLPAAEMEEAVVDHIRCIASDAELRRDVLQQSQAQSASELEGLAAQERSLIARLSRCHEEIERMATDASMTSVATDRLATLHEQIAQIERTLATVRSDAESLREQHFSELDINAAFADFNNIWNALTTTERIQVLKLLVERVQFDAEDSTIAITLHPSGIKSLTQTLNPEPESKEATG